MILLLAVGALLAVPQEADVERWVELLGHEDPKTRDEAEKRLLEIGEPARGGVLRAASSSDVELRARARRIIAALDVAALRGRVLGPAWKVSLPEGEYVLGDLQRALAPHVPVPVEIPATLAASRVRLGKSEGTEVWRFLDRLCEAHGGLTLPLDRPPGAFALVAGQPSRAPTCYSGPFRIWIDKITLEARHPFGEGWRGGRMVFAIAWQPNVQPISYDYLSGPFDFKITEITDEQGAPIDPRPAKELEGGEFTLDRTRDSCWRRSRDFAYPKEGVRRLGRVKGAVKLAFPAAVRTVEFKNPTAREGDKMTFGSCTVRLSSCRRTKSGVLAELEITRSADRENGFGLLSRWTNSSIKLRGTNGTMATFVVRSSANSFGPGNEGARISGFFPLHEEVESLSFPFVEDHFEHDVPFEFTDVELP